MIHESLNTPVIETLTAREMALLSHNLDRTGDVATLPNGDVYIWTVDRWSRYAAAPQVAAHVVRSMAENALEDGEFINLMLSAGVDVEPRREWFEPRRLRTVEMN